VLTPYWFAEVEPQILQRCEPDTGQGDAVVVPLDPRGRGHGDEVVGVPRLDIPEVAREVLDPGHLAPECHALESVRRHPVVLRVDVRLVDQLTVALEQRELPVAQRAPRFTRDVVALLPWLEQQSAVLVLRRIERRRAIEARAHRERVEEPAGLVDDPAADGQGLVLGVVGLGPVEIVDAEVRRQVGVPQERGAGLPSPASAGRRAAPAVDPAAAAGRPPRKPSRTTPRRRPAAPSRAPMERALSSDLDALHHGFSSVLTEIGAGQAS
jgi:hypothetical protein